MSMFQPVKIDSEQEDDLRAEARSAMFFALRSAFKARADKYNVRAKDIAEALGKDKGYVSRVLNGTSGSIDFETLVVFLEALGHHLPLDPISYEDLKCRKVNFDARPSGIKFSLDTNQAAAVNNLKVHKNTTHAWNIDYPVITAESTSSLNVANISRFKIAERSQ